MTKSCLLIKGEIAKITPTAIYPSAVKENLPWNDRASFDFVKVNAILHSCSMDKISKPNHCAARGGGFVNAAKYYKDIDQK
jgi:hypothetical protein